MTFAIAAYAAVLATLTLLLGYGRSWWRELHPLRVRLSSNVSAFLATSPPDQQTGRMFADLVAMKATVTLSCVNQTDISLRVTEVGFDTQHPLWDRVRRVPRGFHVLPYPLVSGQLPHDLAPRRSWATDFPWDDTNDILAFKMRAYVRLDDGRRNYSRRKRLTRPNVASTT